MSHVAHITQLSARLRISGGQFGSGVDFPCMSILMRFMMDGVPEASFVVATGFKARDPAILSVVHEFSAKIGLQLRCQAYVTARGDYGPGTAWPDVELLVFDGIITGASSYTSRGGQIISLSAIHWLADLNTSILCDRIHPAATDDLLVRANISRGVLGPAIGGYRLPETIDFLGARILEYESPRFSSDLWGNTIKQSLLRFASADTINLYRRILRTGGRDVPSTPTKNTLAETALNRMDLAEHIRVEPLSLDEISSEMKRRIAADLASIFLSSNYGTTYWDKIMACCAQFKFHLIPTVQSATCAPVVPFLDTIWKGIYPSEVENFDSGTGMLRMIRGQVSIGAPSTEPRQPFYAPPNVAFYDLVEEFRQIGMPEHASRFESGMFNVKLLPAWAGGVMTPVYTKKNLDSSINDPGKKTGSPHWNVRDTYDLDSLVAHRMCKTDLLFDLFKGRTGIVKGKLRLDICPGSTVCVLGSGAAESTEDTAFFFGLVMSVEVMLDADNMSACSTTIHLSNIHTLEEQLLPPLVLNAHPMYNRKWTGSTLVNVPGVPGSR